MSLEIINAEEIFAKTVSMEETRFIESEYKFLSKFLLDSVHMSKNNDKSYHHHYNEIILLNSGKIAGAKVHQTFLCVSIHVFLVLTEKKIPSSSCSMIFFSHVHPVIGS